MKIPRTARFGRIRTASPRKLRLAPQTDRAPQGVLPTALERKFAWRPPDHGGGPLRHHDGPPGAPSSFLAASRPSAAPSYPAYLQGPEAPKNASENAGGVTPLAPPTCARRRHPVKRTWLAPSGPIARRRCNEGSKRQGFVYPRSCTLSQQGTKTVLGARRALALEAPPHAPRHPSSPQNQCWAHGTPQR